MLLVTLMDLWVGILMSWLCALGDFNGLVGRNIDELVVCIL